MIFIDISQIVASKDLIATFQYTLPSVVRVDAWFSDTLYTV